jgi:hypothetical protein
VVSTALPHTQSQFYLCQVQVAHNSINNQVRSI